MKPIVNLLAGIGIFTILIGCNTLLNTGTISIEILEPANVIIPENIKKVAVRYNNINSTYNTDFAYYFKNGSKFTDLLNTDSLASEIYYRMFVDQLKRQHFFDSVIELKPKYYSAVNIIDTLIKKDNQAYDTIIFMEKLPPEIIVEFFTALIPNNSDNKSNYTETRVIDPEYGLYNRQEIKTIADSTNADMLLSFDFFGALDGIGTVQNGFINMESVYVVTFWNFYDLNEKKLKYFYNRVDTVSWTVDSPFKLPPRKDAVYNAADISGTRFAEFLIPHWIQVQRMYYRSGHVDLKKTKELIIDGNWLEAAKIWKANVDNRNKAIAAKSMFNMALACEMEGNLDAALDWVVQSYHIYKQKNPNHAYNCQDYIRVLAQRKHDSKKIEIQLNPTDSGHILKLPGQKE